MAGRFVKVAGVAAAGGIGYYLYQAGGDPKVAQKQAEHDASKLSSQIKNDLPGKEKEARSQAEVYKEKTSANIDKAYEDAKKRADGASKKLEEVRQDTGKQLSKAVDSFDKNVEKGVQESKGWISSIFGGK